MADDKAQQIAEKALAQLSAELEAGKSDALKNYLAAVGRFHDYSWNNVLLIQSQRPDATRVAGFHAWHDLDRSVKKGEKGIMILAPILSKVKDEQRPNSSLPGRTESQPGETAVRLTGFRTAYVFDVSQTDGEPLPEFAKPTGDPQHFGDKLKSIAAQRGIQIEYDPTISPALGLSSGGRIRLAPGLSPAEEFAVLAHELAHEMMHHNKDLPRPPQEIRELQAEAVAYVVSQAVGLETNSASADYIALYNGNSQSLAQSLADVQRTSSAILNDLLPEQRLAASDRREVNIPIADNAGALSASDHRAEIKNLPEQNSLPGR